MVSQVTEILNIMVLAILSRKNGKQRSVTMQSLERDAHNGEASHGMG